MRSDQPRMPRRIWREAVINSSLIFKTIFGGRRRASDEENTGVRSESSSTGAVAVCPASTVSAKSPSHCTRMSKPYQNQDVRKRGLTEWAIDLSQREAPSAPHYGTGGSGHIVTETAHSSASGSKNRNGGSISIDFSDRVSTITLDNNDQTRSMPRHFAASSNMINRMEAKLFVLLAASGLRGFSLSPPSARSAQQQHDLDDSDARRLADW